MPTRPLSHEQRRKLEHPAFARAAAENARMNRERRLADPLQAQAQRIRNSAAWRRTRAVVLSRDPLCVTCKPKGLVVPSVEADHVIPLVDRLDLALDLANLQGLCASCHDAKSATERGARRREARDVERTRGGVDLTSPERRKRGAPGADFFTGFDQEVA